MPINNKKNKSCNWTYWECQQSIQRSKCNRDKAIRDINRNGGYSRGQSERIVNALGKTYQRSRYRR